MALSKLLLIDCETTGVDCTSDALCEIGAILFSVSHKAVIQQLSFLLSVDSNSAESVNRISPELTQGNTSSRYAGAVLLDMIEEADALVAHNADFDRPWIDGLLQGWGKPTTEEKGKPWICTCHGITWPDLRPGCSLASLSLAHGVPVWAAHRALTDCIYIAQIFERDELLEEHLEEGLLPRQLVAACVSFDQKDLAKEAGFRWVAERRQWQRTCNQKQIDSFPFSVKPV
jgi:DNA polymerase-3 subunit epsilon